MADDLFDLRDWSGGPVASTVPTLRPYQKRAVAMVEASFESGKMAPLLCLATGSGKTVIAGEIIRREVDRDGTVLFLAPRRELVGQASRALAKTGVQHGIVMAGHDGLSPYEAVQVASIDTLVARVLRHDRQSFRDPGLVVVDEAHLSVTHIRQRLLDRWPNARRLGLTATPSRKDGKALGIIYDALLSPISVAELTAAGHLCGARYFSVSEPDLKGVATVAGDYSQAALEYIMDRPKLVGDVVATFLARASDRRTVVFATSVKHAVALADEFTRNGVVAEAVDAKTPTGERAAVFDRFSRGETQVLCNCFLAAYGFDLPDLSCVVLARPTKSLVLYLQMLGRGLRPAEGKRDCLVLDHSGVVHRHGFATDDRMWTLDGVMALEPSDAKSANERAAAGLIDCPNCQAVFTGSRTCPECGHVLKPRGEAVETAPGELIEINPTPKQMKEAERRHFYAELRAIAAERQFKTAWAAHKFREKFGAFPPFPWNDEPTAHPKTETRRWVQSRFIAWQKSKGAQLRAGGAR